MTCRDAQPLLAGYVLDALDNDEHAALERHLTDGCPGCRREADALRAAMAKLVDAEPILLPRPGLRDEVLARLDDYQVGVAPLEATRERGETPGRRARSGAWRRRVLPYVAAGVAAVAISATIVSWQERRAARVDPAVAAWQERVADEMRLLGADRTRLVSLTPPAGPDRLVGFLVYDELSEQLHVWTRPASRRDGVEPTHAWLLGPEGEVLGKSALEPTADRLSALITAPDLKPGADTQLVLTHEPTDPGDRPAEPLLDTVTLRVD